MTLSGAVALAQVASTPRPAPAPQPDTLVVESSPRQSPQVVTVIHRLTGVKALVLLRRSGQAVSLADDDLVAAPNAITSIIAGYALSDGQNIVTRIPQAEAEVEALTGWYRMAGTSPRHWTTFPPSPAPPRAPVAVGGVPAPRPATPAAAPATQGFVVVPSGGGQLKATYVGLDGSSGLSLLKIQGLKVPATRDANEELLAVGQIVRLFAPARVGGGSNLPQGTIALRVGEVEGRISEIVRTPTGKISRLLATAENLSQANVGGVAINEAGETVGIVELIQDKKVRLIPTSAVRRAAQRVLARQTSVPRPLLGVRGESLAAIPLERFYSQGWSAEQVAEVKKKYPGVMLTSVAPGTPAALANLRPGDVIVRANNMEIKSAEDFSWVINEAGSGANVTFTLFRGQTPKPIVQSFPSVQPTAAAPFPVITPEVFNFQPTEVSVKLSESFFNPAATFGVGGQASGGSLPPAARGLETVALSAKAAAHLGAKGGLLVVFVDPESPAGRAGLHVFDVIESVDGRPLGSGPLSSYVPAGGTGQLQLSVVRDKQRIEIVIRPKEEKK